MRLSIFAITLQATLSSANIRRDLGVRNVIVAEIKDGHHIDEENQQIVFVKPESPFQESFRCSPESGKKLTYNSEKTFVACCKPGQSLLGSPQAVFECCDSGFILAGAAGTGYACCASGQIYDGSTCKPKVKICEKGKQLDVNNECVCPSGTSETPDGGCRSKCSSGVSAGKCYIFISENGYRFGYNNQGWYSAAKDGPDQRFGKFQLCKDQECTASGQINPNDAFRVKDVHGDAKGGQNANHWLTHPKDAGNVKKTQEYSDAGVYAITKWACGRYCLGGLETGLVSSYPKEALSAMSTSVDKQACVPIDITEIPCDIRDARNNCMAHDPSKPCLLGKAPDQLDQGTHTDPDETAPVSDVCSRSSAKPIKDRATRVHKCDTSYAEENFPCSKGKEPPCRGAEVKGWSSAKLPWGGAYKQPGPPKPFEMWVNYDDPVVMSIVDVEAQSEHFLLKLDDEFLGETGGEDGYVNKYIGDWNNPEWCLLNGYTRGYFRIPAGRHKITIEWPQGTGMYTRNNGARWLYGIAKYRFDRLCDPTKCT
ncbi:hypothetical protein HRG_006242 [Hirsutella rhossiliensis]|uniref:Uncharacterized protein n=1 Tax=Hirsutella rhossiliensis TaxID=111463 RepID=A0A9P8N2X7_9HYPO|nr:uncharacterized protein HRG_06242 [Hirsutella rhossiliensis]KAH0963732.1 hypothetical protein HRG_06242 [Hirsutella rhossiliensis]